MKLHFAVKQIFSKLLVPGILILISALLVWMWPIIIQVTSGETLKAFLKLFHTIPFLIFFVGAAMGARYNNSGLTLTSVTLALSYFAFISYSFTGVRALDIANKTEPFHDPAWIYAESGGSSLGLFPDTNVIFFADDRFGLQKLDITDKSNMQSLASYGA